MIEIVNQSSIAYIDLDMDGAEENYMFTPQFASGTLIYTFYLEIDQNNLDYLNDIDKINDTNVCINSPLPQVNSSTKNLPSNIIKRKVDICF